MSLRYCPNKSASLLVVVLREALALFSERKRCGPDKVYMLREWHGASLFIALSGDECFYIRIDSGSNRDPHVKIKQRVFSEMKYSARKRLYLHDFIEGEDPLTLAWNPAKEQAAMGRMTDGQFMTIRADLVHTKKEA